MPLCLFCYSLYCGIKISFVIYINLKSFYRHICNWKLKYWQTINIIGGEHFSCVELNTMFFGLKLAKILLVHENCIIINVILLYCYSNIILFSIVLYQFIAPNLLCLLFIHQYFGSLLDFNLYNCRSSNYCDCDSCCSFFCYLLFAIAL